MLELPESRTVARQMHEARTHGIFLWARRRKNISFCWNLRKETAFRFPCRCMAACAWNGVTFVRMHITALRLKSQIHSKMGFPMNISGACIPRPMQK